MFGPIRPRPLPPLSAGNKADDPLQRLQATTRRDLGGLLDQARGSQAKLLGILSEAQVSLEDLQELERQIEASGEATSAALLTVRADIDAVQALVEQLEVQITVSVGPPSALLSFSVSEVASGLHEILFTTSGGVAGEETSNTVRIEWKEGASGTWKLLTIALFDVSTDYVVLNRDVTRLVDTFYRGFVTRRGIDSTVSEATLLAAAQSPALDPPVLQVVRHPDSFDLQWNASLDPRVDRFNLFAASAESGSPTEAAARAAGAVYSGRAPSFTYEIPAGMQNRFFRFWVEAVLRT